MALLTISPNLGFTPSVVFGETVRSVSGKPVTHSRGLRSPDAASWQFGSPETDSISDFLDVHAYRVRSPRDADLLYKTEWGADKQLIIGEFGVDMTVDSTSRSAVFNAVKGLINHSANCVGGLAWQYTTLVARQVASSV